MSNHTYKSKIPPRLGKTRKEQKNGVHAKRFINRQLRISWQKDNSATTSNFPYHACNGKKNRYVASSKDMRKH